MDDPQLCISAVYSNGHLNETRVFWRNLVLSVHESYFFRSSK